MSQIRRLSSVAASLLLVATACSDLATGPSSGLTASRDLAPTSLGVASPPGYIRIGVVPTASSVTIGSTADYTIVDAVNGNVLLTGSASTAAVTYAGMDSRYRLQVVCGSALNVEARRAAAEADGHPTFTEFVPAANCTRLYLGDYASNESFAVRNAFRNVVISQGHAGTDSFWRIVGTGTAQYTVTRGAQVATTPHPVRLVPANDRVRIGGTTYRGIAEVRVNGAGTLAGINELPIEEYLYGVVPAELNPVIWPQLEAIKAQAVAARTYALAGMGRRSADGYDLLATTADQVYGGVPYEKAMSNEAVDATRGIVATWEGRLISALYSSTSGGHTADNEEAFQASPVAYLRGVPDEERGRSLEHVPTAATFRNNASALSLRAHRPNQFGDDWSRWHRWHYRWSAQEMASVLAASLGAPITEVYAITVTKRGPSGRALEIEYATDAGTFTSLRDRIRASLRYVTESGAVANLPSTLFFIDPVIDPATKSLTGFEVWGGGLGHGVGMSQTGAVGMAEKGYGYDRILRHYYRGITLEQR